jgi:hypothetical protein
MSGETVVFMDPFREEQRAVYRTTLAELEGDERHSMHQALNPLLQLMPQGQQQLGLYHYFF